MSVLSVEGGPAALAPSMAGVRSPGTPIDVVGPDGVSLEAA